MSASRRNSAEVDSHFSDLIDDAELLTPYYIHARYPAEPLLEYTRREAEEALEAAERICQFVRDRSMR